MLKVLRTIYYGFNPGFLLRLGTSQFRRKELWLRYHRILKTYAILILIPNNKYLGCTVLNSLARRGVSDRCTQNTLLCNEREKTLIRISILSGVLTRLGTNAMIVAEAESVDEFDCFN